MTTRILFVCLGNICRSPAAEGVVRAQAEAAGLDWQIDSAGIGNWHRGASPDPRMLAAAARRGVDLSGQRARQVRQQDFHSFSHILAMDNSNSVVLQRAAPLTSLAEIRLFLPFAPELSTTEVPDPYYGGTAGFEHVLDLIEAAGRGLIAALRDGARR
ncbi:MAG: low molecular weight protein-tyrosine-phosphatase [Pseudomonadota bacterium]